MPNLTQQENDLLKLLGSETKVTLRTRELKALSVLIHRMMRQADEALQHQRAHERMAQGFWLVSSGELDENAITLHPGLSDQERDDLLTMLQLRHYAVAWCEQEGIPLTALPEAAPVPVQPISSLPTDATHD